MCRTHACFCAFMCIYKYHTMLLLAWCCWHYCHISCFFCLAALIFLLESLKFHCPDNCQDLNSHRTTQTSRHSVSNRNYPRQRGPKKHNIIRLICPEVQMVSRVLMPSPRWACSLWGMTYVLMEKISLALVRANVIFTCTQGVKLSGKCTTFGTDRNQTLQEL